MKNKEDSIFILLFLLISGIIYLIFYLHNKWADKENKRRILEALTNAFMINDVDSLYKLE